jgi:selenide, water dikinase
LLVGHEGADDAAVYRLTDEIALVQTLDFFTPIVDEPYDFGRVAAANSLSDVFAMGGTPKVALNIVCFPDDALDVSVLHDILRGGHDVVHEAGAVIGGGHSVSDPELKYGLSVTGVVHPDRLWTNAGALPGDVLVLSKPIGTGVLSTAIKRGALGPDDEAALVRTMSTLNRAAADAGHRIGDGLGEDPIHAVTDITGFGLLGHAIEVARSSSVGLTLRAGDVPLLPRARWAAQERYLTRGETDNRTYLGDQVAFADGLDAPLRSLLLDPQTSGGLLFFVAPDHADALVTALQDAGAPAAAVIGEANAGPAGIDVQS